jgi:hypothetical protein
MRLEDTLVVIGQGLETRRSVLPWRSKRNGDKDRCSPIGQNRHPQGGDTRESGGEKDGL